MQKDKEKLIKKMKLEEKAALCSGKNTWQTTGFSEYNIPELLITDGPHGLRKVKSTDDRPGIQESYPATCFPTASGLAASWNRNLLRRVGRALGRECRAQGVNIILGPGVNIKRSPLGGRNFEYFSEDPFLSGQLAVSYITGVQSQGVGTCLKHYVANNQEYRRMTIDARISARALREIYLKAFEIAIDKGKPISVMAAYNRVNGKYCTENKMLLTDILRKEWEFEGIVISDWGAVNDRVKALAAGLDLEMPGSHGLRDQKIVEAVDGGELSVEKLDKTIKRILQTIEKTKINTYTTGINKKENNQLALEAASESMVLLKNDGTLPAVGGNRIAVLGEMAIRLTYQGHGSSRVNPEEVKAFLPEFKKQLSPQTKIGYADGYKIDKSEIDPELFREARKLAADSDLVIIFAGLPENHEIEGKDRKDLNIPAAQVKLINEISHIKTKIAVVLCNGSPVVMPWKNKVNAILEAYLGGQAAAEAIAGILTGKINPSGKLAETFPVNLKDTPAYLNYPGEKDRVLYGEDIFVGYRYYDTRGIEPAFPFGHGLSYTEFEYKNLLINNNVLGEDDILKLSLEVRNIGQRAGKEIIQLYVSVLDSGVRRPVKELKGFKKILLAAGESKEVKFELNPECLSYYEPEIKDWVLEEGEYLLMVGKSSRDIVLSRKIEIQSSSSDRPGFDLNSPLMDICSEERNRQILHKTLAIDKKIKKMLNPGKDSPVAGLANFIDYLPLRGLITFGGGQITEDKLKELIKKLNDNQN